MASLELDRLATVNGSPFAMVTLIALHEDGSPVRGYIRCSGVWTKHQDGQPEEYEWGMPFKTDMRGAVVMNPHIAHEWIVCSSNDKGRYGKVLVEFSEDDPVKVVRFILNERGEE